MSEAEEIAKAREVRDYHAARMARMGVAARVGH